MTDKFRARPVSQIDRLSLSLSVLQVTVITRIYFGFLVACDLVCIDISVFTSFVPLKLSTGTSFSVAFSICQAS